MVGLLFPVAFAASDSEYFMLLRAVSFIVAQHIIALRNATPRKPD